MTSVIKVSGVARFVWVVEWDVGVGVMQRAVG